MRDTTKRDDRAQPRHGLDGRSKVGPAATDLCGQRLVLWRNASHRIADQAIDQLQAVVGPGLVVALGKAVFEQRRIKEIAGVVAGERPSCPVGALQSRSKPDDQHLTAVIAEGGDRRVEPSRLLGACGYAEIEKPWTQRAIAIG